MTLDATLANTDRLLEPFDRLLVERLARLGGETSEVRKTLLAHAVRAVREAHPCLTPELLARTLRRIAPGDSLDLETHAEFREVSESPLVARVARDATHAPRDRPFVLDDAGRLYLARYYDHERALAVRLVALARATPRVAGTPSETLADALFPGPKDGEDRQREAALHACRASLTIVSGGPGTGKTSTVVKVLALLADAALRASQRPPRVVLVAPTGKAASRLTESIRAALDRLPIDTGVRASIATSASTIHRALGVHPNGGFRRGPQRPLEADVVIADEASMVDLALMRALVEAVPNGARLVLLGDRDQLASVEAGSVLADLCVAAQTPGSPLEGTLRELVTSHRFSGASGIGALAGAIRRGDAEAALTVLRDRTIGDATIDEPVAIAGRIPRSLQATARDGYSALSVGSAADRLAALGRYRVLTPHRQGTLGVATLGKRLAAAIGREASEHAAGTPLLILENDAETGLANGDVGVVVTGSGETRQAHVAFESDTGPRSLGTGRLPRHEACWAMSIHKSQGSEFDVVSVVLPERSAIASRELLYTAVTRARERVVVHATDGAIRECVGRSVVRASGLVDAVLALGPAMSTESGARLR